MVKFPQLGISVCVRTIRAAQIAWIDDRKNNHQGKFLGTRAQLEAALLLDDGVGWLHLTD